MSWYGLQARCTSLVQASNMDLEVWFGKPMCPEVSWAQLPYAAAASVDFQGELTKMNSWSDLLVSCPCLPRS